MTRIVNSRYLIKTQHRKRIYFVAYCFAFSPFLTAICLVFSDYSFMFFVVLLAMIIMGIGSSLGESVILGFLKTFPGEAIGYFSTGTGIAGLSGSLIFLSFRSLGFKYSDIFMLVIPLSIPYLLSFMWLNRQKKKYPYMFHS